MFSQQIIDSDAFLDMPASAQSLYFHLGMRGDDEGFINSPKKIQRMVGASDDDVRILIAKNFVIPFDSGVIVIKHWKIHNTLRSDRLKQTVYQDEKKKLSIKNNGVYTLTDICQTDDRQLTGKCTHSLVECSVVEGSVVMAKNPQTSLLDDFQIFWKNYPKKKKKADAEKAWKKLKPNLDEVLGALDWQTKSKDWLKDAGQFIPYPASYLNSKSWLDEPEEMRAAF